MANRTPLTARAEELMFDLQLEANRIRDERIQHLARQAAAVFGQMNLERIDYIYRVNHGDDAADQRTV